MNEKLLLYVPKSQKLSKQEKAEGKKKTTIFQRNIDGSPDFIKNDTSVMCMYLGPLKY